jgi:molybdopterin/thiamine biosynthesis adenylyltransferase
MGFKHVVVYDHDKLEEHNLSSSLYPTMFLDTNKAEAAVIQAREYNPNIHADNFGEWWSYMWDDKTGMGNKYDLRKVIVCPDNMEVRIDAYNAWKEYIEDNPCISNTAFFIDIRMDALALEVITVTPYNMDAYENY